MATKNILPGVAVPCHQPGCAGGSAQQSCLVLWKIPLDNWEWAGLTTGTEQFSNKCLNVMGRPGVRQKLGFFWEREWKSFRRHLWFGGAHTGLSQLNKLGIFSVLWQEYLGICGAEEQEGAGPSRAVGFVSSPHSK